MKRLRFLAILLAAPAFSPTLGAAPDAATRPGADDTFTVATYNIRHGRGMDDVVDLTRTANAIGALGADVVALQEVDRGVERSGRADEPRVLGDHLGFEHAFGAFFPYQGGEYGMALLSRFPIRRSHTLRLPDGNEPRVALFAEIELPSGRRVQVVNVHFDWVANDTLRYAQVQALAAVLDTASLPTVLLGDFNDVPGSRTLERWRDRFATAAKPEEDHLTFSSTDPTKEIDHILLGPPGAWEPATARVVTDPVTSDHRAVVAGVRLGSGRDDGAAAVERTVHEIDVGPLVGRFMTPEGFMDPGFPPTVASASPHLTDFFGVLALGDVPAAEIVADFVPSHARLVREGPGSVILAFEGGFEAEFFPFSTFSALGRAVPLSHASVSGDTWREVQANLGTMIGLIEGLGRADAYLVPNDFYEWERATEAQLLGGRAADVRVDPTLAEFARAEDGVLLVTEAVHGLPDDLNVLRGILEDHAVDWVGMEMVSTDLQGDLEAYNRSAAGSPEHERARAVLVDWFTREWNGRAGPLTAGDANPYFLLLEEAHRRGVRVVALEGGTTEFFFFRYGETEFGGAVRSRIWAGSIPREGRGVVFGGAAHFRNAKPIDVQDFIAALQPGRPLFSLVPLDR